MQQGLRNAGCAGRSQDVKQDKKSGLFVPGQKLPERVREMAWQLFVRSWDRATEAVLRNEDGRSRAAVDWDAGTCYRRCVETAKLCYAIEAAEQ